MMGASTCPQAKLVRRNIKVVDIVNTWDKTGDGEVGKDNFCMQVAKLGVVASNEELNELKVKQSGEPAA